MNTTHPANPLRAAAEAIRTAGLHDSPMRLAKAALAAAGFAETERRLRAVRALVDAAGRDAALFGRGGPGCVNVTSLRAALAGSYRAPENDYTEHLISMAGGDGDETEASAAQDAISGMVEVLVAHQRQNSSGCLCGWSELGKSHPEHQAAALSAAGFGPVTGEKRLMQLAALMAYDAVEDNVKREAAAKALEDAADELARLPYVKPGAKGRDEYERVLAVRRGDADKWLKARADAVRGEG